jgi:hypothetical protein
MLDLMLLIQAPTPALTEPASRIGGAPLADGDRAWPHCARCDGPMQFLGQLRVPGDKAPAEHLVAMFMCQNDPGMCEEWDAEAGGNAVRIQPARAGSLLDAPTHGVTRLASSYGLEAVVVASSGYDDAFGEWRAKHGADARRAMGGLFGEPSWIQADETPACDACRQPMRFVAQLEEGPDMNFGGGCAYVFDCACGTDRGKMVWQQ